VTVAINADLVTTVKEKLPAVKVLVVGVVMPALHIREENAIEAMHVNFHTTREAM